MDGSRIRDYLTAEIDALVRKYTQFETLIPANERAGSAHPGEDGRFVEELIRQYLSAVLPRELEVLTGFILRSAVKTGTDGQERRGQEDEHSTQLDIIIYDSARYPVFQRLGTSAIVPPEGVVAIISVKKHLNEADIKTECAALQKAARLCANLKAKVCTNKAKDSTNTMRGPYLAFVAVHTGLEKPAKGILQWTFEQMSKAYGAISDLTFDEVIGYVGVLDGWGVFKRRPSGNGTKAEFVGLTHKANESHLGYQFLLTGILSVFYDESRSDFTRPGFTAFTSGRPHDVSLGSISCSKIR